MVPRVKVNYTAKELLISALKRESSFTQRNNLVNQLGQMFPDRKIVLTPSGRGALYYLLKSLPHERVIVPGYTCKAVVEAIILAGKTVEHVEVEYSTFNMCSDSLKKCGIDANCILVATHQYGIPCDIEVARDVCDSAGAYLIEDVAAGFCSRHNGKLLGMWGDASFFSFDSTKLLNTPLKSGFIAVHEHPDINDLSSAVEAESKPMGLFSKCILLLKGLVLTALKSPSLYSLFHKLNFQWRGKYSAETRDLDLTKNGFYTHAFAEWQAYLINRQLLRLAKIIDFRKFAYQKYSEELETTNAYNKPPKDINNEWVCIRFPILVTSDKHVFYQKAVDDGVDCAFSFTHISAPESMRASQRIATEVLNLPFYFGLSKQELQHTINTINKLSHES